VRREPRFGGKISEEKGKMSEEAVGAITVLCVRNETEVYPYYRQGLKLVRHCNFYWNQRVIIIDCKVGAGVGVGERADKKEEPEGAFRIPMDSRGELAWSIWAPCVSLSGTLSIFSRKRYTCL